VPTSPDGLKENCQLITSLGETGNRFPAEESWLYLPGTELKGVHPTLPFLKAVSRREAPALGTRVCIIGGGNAAISSARTVLCMGSAATILYRRERKDMPAIDEEIRAAEESRRAPAGLAARYAIGRPASFR
jgi:NADPH-dependent glutamate synthase beta subunit-like oxidoreductase